MRTQSDGTNPVLQNSMAQIRNSNEIANPAPSETDERFLPDPERLAYSKQEKRTLSNKVKVVTQRSKPTEKHDGPSSDPNVDPFKQIKQKQFIDVPMGKIHES